MQGKTLTAPALAGAFLEQATQRLKARLPVVLSGLAGASKAWVIARMAERIQGQATVAAAPITTPLVILTESYEKAERLHQDLVFFAGEGRVFAFPQWDTLPFDAFSPTKAVMAQRFAALDALQTGRCAILVTTPQAFMQGMMPMAEFQARVFALKPGQTWPREALVERLLAAGYVRVDLVEAPGEFSARGEIVDVFPIQLEHPLRLDFFGDELESLKAFEVDSQKSFHAIPEVMVYPASEGVVNAQTAQRARTELPRHKSRFQPDIYRQLYAFLERAQPFPGVEQLMGLLYTEVGWLHQALPAGSLLLLDEPVALEQRIRDFSAEVFQEYEICLEQGNAALPPEQFYLNPQDVQAALKPFYRPELHELRLEQVSTTVLGPFANNLALRTPDAAKLVAPNAHASVQAVAEHLRQWHAQGVAVVVAARSHTGAERLRHLLTQFEIGAAVVEDPRRFLDFLVGDPPPPTEITLLSQAPGEGFRVVDELGETRFALLTEEELLGEKTRQRRVKKSNIQHFLSTLGELKEGDAVVHIEYGIGRYQGLRRMKVGRLESDFLVLAFAGDDKVYVPVYNFNQVQKYTGLESTAPQLSRLGDGAWGKSKQKVLRHVREMADELVKLYARRQMVKGHAFEVNEALMTEFEQAFAFEETEDQSRAIEEVLGDMRSDRPMDRLVCGDVGFGKTEVAMRAAYMSALGGKQVLVLVPTTILAQQHYETFHKRFAGFPVKVEVISRFRDPKEQKETLQHLAQGGLDILIGTHRLLGKDVVAKDLGLLVVDEEQRFGVAHKEKIKQLKAQVEVLTLSATPIPRTLHMSLMGVRDLSIINTPPMDRMAVRTRLFKSSDYIIREAVMREVRRGGQVFFVHNRVETIHAYASYLQSLLPGVRIGIAHGQMAEKQLEDVMLAFMEAQLDLLLSTSIIESGLDIPRANTIVINNADSFGLSQLYQMRGRVGRSNVQAYAYLLVSPDKLLTEVAQKRLTLLQELNDLGSGFKIASHDLEIRGAGNLLGAEQSGHINTIGLDLYTRMVEDAVAELRGEERTAASLSEFKMDLGFPFLIPETFIASTQQRLDIYKQLAEVRSEEEVWGLRQSLEDRFGRVPPDVDNLLALIRVRLLALRLGLQSLERVGDEFMAQFAPTHAMDVDKLMALVTDPQNNLRLLPGDRLSLGTLPATPEATLQRLKTLEAALISKAA